VQKQANCYWCTADILADSVYQVKTFWNRQNEGYPIYSKCLGSFKEGNQLTENQRRERLGLKPEIKEKKGLDKWLSSA